MNKRKKPKPEIWNYLTCPECGSDNHRIYTSGYHHNKGGVPKDMPAASHIRRVRYCGDCGKRWPTFEISAVNLPMTPGDGMAKAARLIERAARELNNLAAELFDEDVDQ